MGNSGMPVPTLFNEQERIDRTAKAKEQESRTEISTFGSEFDSKVNTLTPTPTPRQPEEEDMKETLYRESGLVSEFGGPAISVEEIMGNILKPDTKKSKMPFCIKCGNTGITIDGKKCMCGRKPYSEIVKKSDFAPEFFVPAQYRTNFWTKEEALKNQNKIKLGLSDREIDFRLQNWVNQLDILLRSVRESSSEAIPLTGDYFIAAPDHFGKKRWLFTLIHSLYIRGFMTSQVLILDDVRDDSADIVSPHPLILLIPCSHRFKYNLGLLEYILQKRRLFGYTTIIVTNIKTVGFEREVDKTIMDLGTNMSIYERGDILYGRTIKDIEDEYKDKGTKISTTLY